MSERDKERLNEARMGFWIGLLCVALAAWWLFDLPGLAIVVGVSGVFFIGIALVELHNIREKP